jgi:hypothetical protein
MVNRAYPFGCAKMQKRPCHLGKPTRHPPVLKNNDNKVLIYTVEPLDFPKITSVVHQL